ncbi:hypothetical protein [Conexibacter woesei]|uniref:hypothetical protein n=1 Tax=Conexibacter woesei TaxID=191495 RepID=UPI00047D2A7F|nr:hypothetical protein [Conexibacter woesei]
MSSEADPTTTGPEPAEAAAQAPQAPVEQPHVPAPDPAPEPTPTVGTADASFGAPAGSAAFGGTTAGDAVDPHPEKLVGAAFAGGLVGAVFLKVLAKRRHR